MADTLATVTAKVRAHLNDLDVQQYTDSYLVTYVGMAQSQLDQWLASKGCDRYRIEATVTVLAGTKVVNFTTSPALPADFQQPIVLHERKAGSTSANDWRAMVQVREDLPNLEPREILGFWSWQGGAIRFLGATTNREVQLDYLNVPAEVALPTDVLPVSDSAEAVAYKTAELVTHAAGELEMSQSFERKYLKAADNIYSLAMRQKQRRVLRRPFYYRGQKRSPFIT